jgi:hypothetical protein
MLGIASALLAFAVQQAVTFDATSMFVSKPALLFVMSVGGLAFSLLANRATREYGEHINVNNASAGAVEEGATFADIIERRKQPKSGQSLPNICQYGRFAAWSLSTLFVVGVLLSVLYGCISASQPKL